MGRADAGDAAGRDFAALGNEGVQQAHVLVIDVVDFVDAEPAHFFAPEILLLAHHGFVAAGGTRGTADGSAASGFCHNYSFTSVDSGAATGGAPGAAWPGVTAAGSAGRAGMAGAAAAGTEGDAIGGGAGRRAARLSRAFLRF